MSPVSPGTPTLELNVVQAALAVGVEHAVKCSVWGASTDASIARRRDHARIENVLATSGLGYTLLRPQAFMQNNMLLYAPAIKKTGRFGSSHGSGGVAMVDVRDIAAVAAKIAAAPFEQFVTDHRAAYR